MINAPLAQSVVGLGAATGDPDRGDGVEAGGLCQQAVERICRCFSRQAGAADRRLMLGLTGHDTIRESAKQIADCPLLRGLERDGDLVPTILADDSYRRPILLTPD